MATEPVLYRGGAIVTPFPNPYVPQNGDRVVAGTSAVAAGEFTIQASADCTFVPESTGSSVLTASVASGRVDVNTSSGSFGGGLTYKYRLKSVGGKAGANGSEYAISYSPSGLNTQVWASTLNASDVLVVFVQEGHTFNTANGTTVIIDNVIHDN